MAYGESNGYVTDDVTWPWKIWNTWPQYAERAISRKQLETI